MLTTDSTFFIRLPSDSNERILHPAKLAGQENGIYMARLGEADLPLAEGLDVLIYFQNDREFMQQPARVLAISADEPGLVIQISTTGDSVSAERRQYYRASVVMLGLTIEFGAERDCLLLDVSCTGFAVAAREEHEIGSLVDTVLSLEGEEYRGTVCVQSKKELTKGRTRYGLFWLDCQESGKMPSGLHRMNLSLQQEQLRRPAGV